MNREVQEIEHHLHNNECWLEPRAVPNAEITVGIEAGTVPTAVTAYQIDAGNNAWGAWTIILGSSDTPCSTFPGNKFFDCHKIGITACERTSLYYIQIGYGTVAGGVLTGDHTTIWFNPTALTGKTEGILFTAPKKAIGTKVWARCLCPGQNTATIDFNIGIHHYLS